ncbi:MAG: class I SAM-dependent methyltransferase [Bacillota bacterium]
MSYASEFSSPSIDASTPDWTAYLQRYRKGEWRGFLFRDMILEEARQREGPLAFLDIGCGRGLDGYLPPQETIARTADQYIGIEPDPTIQPAPFFTEVHRCLFEDAPLRAHSIDVALAVMVLEHLASPQRFWDKLWDVLVDGGVFWAMTVDARHWFCHASLWADRLRLKGPYLTWLMGQRGVARYENYPVHYRCNTPRQIRHYAKRFRRVHCFNFSRVGQSIACFPLALRSLATSLDRYSVRLGKPGPLLVVQAVK